MNNNREKWFLPKHLERYRKYIRYEKEDTMKIEGVMNSEKLMTDMPDIEAQVKLLNRLFSAGEINE